MYGVMHAVLASVTLVPLPLCHFFWTTVADNIPGVRRVVPVDDFEYWHKVLGYIAISGLVVGPLLWAALMAQACDAGDADKNAACQAFAREAPKLEGGPFLLPERWERSVLVLRLLLAPLWVTVLPLMQFARQRRCALKMHQVFQNAEQRTEFATRAWLLVAGMATGTCWGFALFGKGPLFVGALVGILLGLWAGQSSFCATNWFEICYW